MNKLSLILISALTLTGCAWSFGASNLRFQFTRTTELKPPAKAANCRFDFLTLPPQQPFVELGVLSMSLVVSGSLGALSIQNIMTDVSPHVCAQGGDAIVYPQGTIVVYRNARAAAGNATNDANAGNSEPPPVTTKVAAEASAPPLAKTPPPPPLRPRSKEDWRMVGLAACKAHDGSTANEAYRATDSDSALLIKAECLDAGFKLINGAFRAL